MRDTPLHDDSVYDCLLAHNLEMQDIELGEVISAISDRELCVISEEELQSVFDENFVSNRDLGDEDLK